MLAGTKFTANPVAAAFVPSVQIWSLSGVTLWDKMRSMETRSFDLLYLESDPDTMQPSACLCIKSVSRQDYAGVGVDRLVTPPCLSFIELDAEIRRLHAELDEIRARAKRKFYKAEASAAGA